MVSLEEKVSYQTRIDESYKLSALNNLLLGKPHPPILNSEINEIDQIYLGIISAIHSNDKAAFTTHFNKKNKSNPSKESPSPFVNDDFLIFCLIVGIIKFNEDKQWITRIITLRNKNDVTITFENLLKEDFYSKSNLPEIVLMFFQMKDQTLIKNDFLTIAFKNVSNNTSLFENKNDFYIICSIRAYDLIITLKESPDGGEVFFLKKFEEKFTKRIKILAWFAQTVILIAIIYFGFGVLSKYPIVKEFVDKIASIFKFIGLIGLSQIGNISPSFKKYSYNVVLWLFGYPKQLIKET